MERKQPSAYFIVTGLLAATLAILIFWLWTAPQDEGPGSKEGITQTETVSPGPEAAASAGGRTRARPIEPSGGTAAGVHDSGRAPRPPGTTPSERQHLKRGDESFVFSGTVSDGRGRRLQSVLISVAEAVEGNDGSQALDGRAAEVRSDASGRFRLVFEKPLKAYSRVDAPGFETLEGFFQLTPAEPRVVRNFTLFEALGVEGRVLDFSTRRPIQGAKVSLSYRVTSLAPESLRQRQTTLTDGRGRFLFEKVRAGAPFQLRSDADGYLAVSRAPFSDAGEVEGEIILEMKPARVMTVEVRGAGAEAVPRAHIMLAAPETAHFEPGTRSFFTDERGMAQVKVEADAVSPVHLSRISARGYLTREGYLDVREAVNHVILEAPAPLRGVVRNQAGDPVEAARVSIGEGGIRPEWKQSVATNEDGTFVIAPQKSRVEWIEVSHPNYLSWHEIFEGETYPRHSEVVLQAGTGVVEGRVLLPDGSPARRFRLSLKLQSEDGSAGGRGGLMSRKISDAAGRFAVAGLPSGAYQITAIATDAQGNLLSTLSAAEIVLEGREPVRGVVLQLRPIRRR